MIPAPPVLFVPAVQSSRGGRKSLFPSEVTVKGKYMHMDGAFSAALFWDGLFIFSGI